MKPVPQTNAAMQAYAESDRELDLYQAAERMYRNLDAGGALGGAMVEELMRRFAVSRASEPIASAA